MSKEHPPLLPRLELVSHPRCDPGVPVRDVAHSQHVRTPVSVEPATYEVQVVRVL